MSYFSDRARELGVGSPKAGEKKKGESYFQQRARELGVSATPPSSESSASNYFIQRQKELGITGDTKQKEPVGLKPTNSALNSFLDKQTQSLVNNRNAPSTTTRSSIPDKFLDPAGQLKPTGKVELYNPNTAQSPAIPGTTFNQDLSNRSGIVSAATETDTEKWLRQQAANRKTNREENPNLLSRIDEFMEPSNVLVDKFQAYTPGVAAFQRGAGQALGVSDVVNRNAAPVTGSNLVNVPASVIGNIAGLASVPGPNQLTAPYQGASGVVASKGGQALTRGNKYADKALEGAIGGAVQGGAASLISGETDTRDVLKNAGLGAALGAVGDPLLYGAGKVTGSLFNRMKQNNIDDAVIQEVQEMLALPAPRQRGNSNTVQTPNVVTPEYTFGLPAPKLAAPTSARISQQSNPYRDQFENLMRTAQKLQDEGLFTPGREAEELESLWSQMAGREGVGLDELIQRAYPTKSKISPDLVQNARNNQYSREVAGAPMPVQSLGDRMPQQGQINRAASPITVLARSEQGEVPRASSFKSQRKMNTIPPVPQYSTTARQNTPAGERSFFSNLEQGDLTPEVRQGLKESDRGYERKTNQASLDIANARIASKGIDVVESKLLNKRGRYTAEDVATGMRAVQDLQASGNATRAVTLVEQMSRELTNAGQVSQAASMWKRLSPEGALLGAQRRIDRINDSRLRFQKEAKISETQANDIQQAASAIQAAGVSQERASAVTEILERVRKGEDVPLAERQALADFVADAKQFLKPKDSKPPKQAKAPKEMADRRIRDRVISTLEEQEKAALERIRARRGRMNSLPLDEWSDYAYVGALKLAKGVVKFADFSDQMIRDLGEGVRPYLRQIYEKSQETLNINAKKVTDKTVSQAEKVAEGYLKYREATLSPDDVTMIRNMAQGVSELSGSAERAASQDLQAILNGFEKAGVGKKLSSAQYISMLLNPVTQVRNIAGNELMYRAERIARIMGTPIDIAASKLSGGKRQITFKSGPSIWDDFFKPTKDYWSNLAVGMKAGARGVSPDGLTSKYEIQGNSFTSKYNPLTYLEKALGATLQGFDYAAFTRATNQRMQEMGYLDALNSGVKGRQAIKNHVQDYMTRLDDTTHAIAKDYGKYATLQDDTFLSQAVTQGRRLVNQLTGSPNYGIGSVVMPFAKTPANLTLRALDYSPVGILKALKQTSEILLKPKGKTDLTRADVIDSVTRSLFGTGLGAAAWWLADKGVINGKSNKDADVRKLQQGTGIKDFQINGSAIQRMLKAIGSGEDIDKAAKMQAGDTLWAYNWAQPVSMPMAIGSNIQQGMKSGDSPLKTAGDSSFAALSTILDSSVMSGVMDVFSVPVGEDNSAKAIISNLIKQVPGQFTPSIIRQINTVMDDTTKETWTKDPVDKVFNSSKANIPGLSQELPQRVDTLGQKQTKTNSIFDVFITPASRSKYQPTPESQLVIDLLNETGDASLAPRGVSKDISGKDVITGAQKKVDLTPEQYVEFQTIVGQETVKRLQKINPDLPTDKKVELVLKALDEAGKVGRNEMKSKVGIRKAK